MTAPINWPKPSAIYAKEFLSLGEQYLDAFKALGQEAKLERSYVRYHLLGHALELIIKSTLVLNGVSRGQLRVLGHNIERLFDEYSKRSLPHIKDLPDLVRHISESHSNAELRYPENFISHLLYPAQCITIVDELLEHSRYIISAEALDAQLQLASDTRHLRGRKIRLT